MSVPYFTDNLNHDIQEYLPPRCQNRNRGIWKSTHAIYADLYTVVGHERALERR